MRIWKSIILLLGVAMLVLSAISVSAVSDPEGDVYHQTFTDGQLTWDLSGERENIDITDVSHSVSGNDVTLSLTVKGSIQNNENIVYYAYLKKDISSYYHFWYVQGSGFVTAVGDFSGFFDMDPAYTISGDGKTVSYTITDVDTSIEYEPWGFGAEYVNYQDDAGGEAWYDYAPDTDAPWYLPGGDGDVTCWQCNENNESVSQTFPAGTVCGEGDAENYPYNTQPTCGNGGNGGGGGTPGFEMIAVIAAIGAAFIILRRRK